MMDTLCRVIDSTCVRTDSAGNTGHPGNEELIEKIVGVTATVTALDRATRYSDDTSESVYSN